MGKEKTSRIKAGLNLDALGGDQKFCGCPVTCQRTPHAIPSYVNTLMRKILAQQAQLPSAALTRETSFYETIGGDNHCSDPLIGIQCSSLWMHPSRHWHTSADVLDTLDPVQLKQLGQVALTFLTFAAEAGEQEIIWLAKEIEKDGVGLLTDRRDIDEWKYYQQMILGAFDSLTALGSSDSPLIKQYRDTIATLEPPKGFTRRYPGRI